ncbi:MAG: DUF616 domain-containing protein [Bacteroidales bacterium]|nr:DUF616 domain-containing protein [Bacteroidales bacterium]
MNTKVVYTIILGSYDGLKEPEIVNSEFDYICFTNKDDLTSNVWTIRKISCERHKSLKRCAAELIVYPFRLLKGYEISVLVGGQVSILCDIRDFVKNNLPPDKGLSIMRHPHRNCTYEEARVVLECRKDYPDIVHKQMKRYRKNGLPEHAGMVATGILIRRHSDKKMKKHCRLWLREVRKSSQRDQLSFNYVLWKYKLIDPFYYSLAERRACFNIHPHNNRQVF